MLPRLYRK